MLTKEMVAYILGVLDALAMAHLEPRQQIPIFAMLGITPTEIAAVMEASAASEERASSSGQGRFTH